jgi:hypothetical protein
MRFLEQAIVSTPVCGSEYFPIHFPEGDAAGSSGSSAAAYSQNGGWDPEGDVAAVYEVVFECGTSVDRTGRVAAVAVVADLLFCRSARLLIEQLQYNLLFQWFVGMEMDEEVCCFEEDVNALIANADSDEEILPNVPRKGLFVVSRRVPAAAILVNRMTQTAGV